MKLYPKTKTINIFTQIGGFDISSHIKWLIFVSTILEYVQD